MNSTWGTRDVTFQETQASPFLLQSQKAETEVLHFLQTQDGVLCCNCVNSQM